MSNAAEQIQNWLTGPGNSFHDPVSELTAFIEKTEDDIRRYAATPNARQGYIDKRLAEIEVLRKIHETLETLAPLEIWHKIGSILQAQTDVDGIHLIIPTKVNARSDRMTLVDLSKIA